MTCEFDGNVNEMIWEHLNGHASLTKNPREAAGANSGIFHTRNRGQDGLSGGSDDWALADSHSRAPSFYANHEGEKKKTPIQPQNKE